MRENLISGLPNTDLQSKHVHKILNYCVLYSEKELRRSNPFLRQKATMDMLLGKHKNRKISFATKSFNNSIVLAMAFRIIQFYQQPETL
jgi:hypothetical protein